MTAPPVLPCPLERLVPHRAPMQLLEALEVYSDDKGEAVGIVGLDHLFAEPAGTLHPAVLIEMLAQTAAAHQGYEMLADGGAVGGGFLAAIRDFEVFAAPRPGDTVRCKAERGLKIGDLQLVSGHLEMQGRTLGRGELMFYLNDDLGPDSMPRPDDLPATTFDGSAQTILEALANSIGCCDDDPQKATFTFENDFPAFQGHFPSYPILPAVVSVMMAELLVRHVVGSEWRISRIKKAKFPKPILPNMTVEASCTAVSSGSDRAWRVRLESQGDLFARLTLEGGGSTSVTEPPSPLESSSLDR